MIKGALCAFFFAGKNSDKPEIFGPLTILGFPVVGSYMLRSIAVKSTLDTYRCSTTWPP
jgi:hypothetical protein